MGRTNRNTVALFDEEEEMDHEETPEMTPTTPVAEPAKRTPGGKKPAKNMKKTADELFASTFAGSDDECLHDPADEDEGETGKRTSHVVRGHTSASKPISADLDGADLEIIRMKESGEPLSKISAMLKEDFDLKYEPKSVHSRYLRLKEALAAQKDLELALGLDSWHEGEVDLTGDHNEASADHGGQDEALLAAYDKANEVIEGEYEKLKARRFTYTARALAQLKPSVNYSAKACSLRYRALLAGTATIPPELDDNPEMRAEEMAENRIKWMEEQDKKVREGLEADERARIAQSTTKKKWHERLKGAVDRDHDRVLEERRRLLALLEAKDKKLATLEKRKVTRAAKLERLASGADGKARKRPTVKELEGKRSAALMRKVSGIDEPSMSPSPSPRLTRKRKSAATDRSSRKKRRSLTDSEPESDEDDSMNEGDADGGTGSEDEYVPTTRKRGAAKALRDKAAGTDSDEA